MCFDFPTQVKFFDGEDWAYGIAYGEKIICACCGGTFEIEEIVANGHQIKQLSWIDFKDAISE